jgi:hypothetical protein
MVGQGSCSTMPIHSALSGVFQVAVFDGIGREIEVHDALRLAIRHDFPSIKVDGAVAVVDNLLHAVRNEKDRLS